MNGWTDLLSSAAVIVSLVSAGALGLQRSKVASLRADLNDERTRSAGFRQDVADLKVKDAEKDASIAALRTKLEYAEALALREDQWKRLDDHQQEHNRKAEAHWKRENEIWTRIEQHMEPS